MKRLLGMFRERDAGDEARAALEPRPLPESREAWSPEGEVFFTPHAGPPLLGGEAAKSDAIAPSPSPSKGQGASSPGLLPLEGHPLEASIIEALKGVYDPEIPVNIYELGLIYDVKLSLENDVFVKMTLTAPGCPVAGQMPGMVRASIEEHVPEARDVDVEIVWDPPWTTERMSEAAKLETGML